MSAVQIEQLSPQRVIFEEDESVQRGVQVEVVFPLSFAALSGWVLMMVLVMSPTITTETSVL